MTKSRNLNDNPRKWKTQCCDKFGIRPSPLGPSHYKFQVCHLVSEVGFEAYRHPLRPLNKTIRRRELQIHWATKTPKPRHHPSGRQSPNIAIIHRVAKRPSTRLSSQPSCRLGRTRSSYSWHQSLGPSQQSTKAFGKRNLKNFVRIIAKIVSYWSIE
jgi:hypothetical protein